MLHTHIYIFIHIDGWVRIDISHCVCRNPVVDRLGPWETAGDERGLFTDCGECESLPRWQGPCIPGAELWSLVVVLLCCLLVDGFSKLSDRNGKCRIMFETYFLDLFGTNL